MAPSKHGTIAAIRQIAQRLEAVCAVFGMGSYFRGEPFNDLDLVVVVAPTETITEVGRTIRTALAPIAEMVGVPIDVTILTQAEFAERPLRDMHTLSTIYDTSQENA